MSTSTALSPLEARSLAVHRELGALAPFIGPARVPDGPTLIPSMDGTDWVVLALADDPHFRAGGLGMPDDVRDHVATIAAAGVTFDALYLGHELPLGTVEAVGAEQLKDPKRLATLVGPPKTDTRAAAAADTTAAAFAAVWKGLRRGAVGAALGIAAAGIAAGSAFEGLDPVLLGAVTATGRAEAGELASWWLLARWI